MILKKSKRTHRTSDRTKDQSKGSFLEHKTRPVSYNSGNRGMNKYWTILHLIIPFFCWYIFYFSFKVWHSTEWKNCSPSILDDHQSKAESYPDHLLNKSSWAKFGSCTRLTNQRKLAKLEWNGQIEKHKKVGVEFNQEMLWQRDPYTWKPACQLYVGLSTLTGSGLDIVKWKKCMSGSMLLFSSTANKKSSFSLFGKLFKGNDVTS